MAYNRHLANRVSQLLHEKNVAFEVRKMMGGLCYMVDDKMCLGVHENRLMARIDKEKYEDLLKRKGAEKMMFTGREMKGFIFVSDQGIDLDKDLVFWVNECLEFNPKAKSSKKRETKP